MEKIKIKKGSIKEDLCKDEYFDEYPIIASRGQKPS